VIGHLDQSMLCMCRQQEFIPKETKVATQAEYTAVAAALKAWAIATYGEWKESFIDSDLLAGAKVAVDTLDATRAKEKGTA
jgi:hypothetical protein